MDSVSCRQNDLQQLIRVFRHWKWRCWGRQSDCMTRRHRCGWSSQWPKQYTTVKLIRWGIIISLRNIGQDPVCLKVDVIQPQIKKIVQNWMGCFTCTTAPNTVACAGGTALPTWKVTFCRTTPVLLTLSTREYAVAFTRVTFRLMVSFTSSEFPSEFEWKKSQEIGH